MSTNRTQATLAPVSLITPIAAALATALFVALAYATVWPLSVDVGARDARFAQGFHEPERFGETLFRWTTADSSLTLPRPPGGTNILTLRLLNGYPEGQPDPHITLRLDGRTLGDFDVTRGLSGVRHYQLLAPVGAGLSWGPQLQIQSTTYTPPGDPRLLGAVVDWARVAPTLQTAPVLPWFQILSSLALGGLLAAALLLAGIGRGAALGISLGVAALVALGVAQRPIELLPFLQRLAAVPAVACLGLLLIRAIVPAAQPVASARCSQGAPAAGRRRLRGEYLPILFALVWWMLPVFQALQIIDGASIGVGSETFWLGGIAAVLLAIGMAAGAAWGRSLPPDERRGAVTGGALAGLGLGAAVHLSYALSYAFTRTAKDFWILFKGTRDFVQGGSLYDLNAVLTNHVGAVFKVPPFYAMLFTPFVFQDGLQIVFYHRLINVGLMLATAGVLLAMFRPRPIWWGIATMAILLNSRPLADTIAYGQIDLMLLFLLTCALWAMRSDRDGLAGALIALGVLFKVYPVILLAFFVLKGRWRGLVGFAVGMLAYNGLAVAVMGWEMHRVYLLEVLPRIGGTTSWVENQTISGFLARLSDAPFEAHLFDNRALSLLGTAISGLLSLLACWLTLRPAQGKSTLFALQYSQFLLLMVLAVPAAWMHYETLLVLVFAVALIHLRERDVTLPQAAALALGFALVSYGNQWSFNGTTVMGILTVLGISYKFYGMLLLGAVMLECILEEPAKAVFPALPWGLRLGAQRRWTMDDGR
jgi:hypothetical protein